MHRYLLIFSLIMVSQKILAQDFNGYIIKYSEGLKLDKNIQVNRQLKTTFGNFALIAGNKKLDLNKMVKNPNIEYIEPNYIYYTQQTFAGKDVKDTKFKKQWSLNNTGKNSSSYIFFRGMVGEDINALKSWEITKGSREIKIAVLDTGIDYTHPDLLKNIWTNSSELNGISGVDDDGNGYIDDIYGYDFANQDGDPLDGHGHGTHCAGIIGAVHNDIGIRGVMGEVSLIGLKFMSDKGQGELIHAIEALHYAIKMRVDIISNSWGGDPKSKALKDAIIATRDEGILFVAAAGNSKYGNNNDENPIYPANYDVDNVISVGASNYFGNRAIFSNSGKKTVHLFAPGKKIISTVLKGRYKKMDGTSMAAPLVAGTLGLLLTQQRGISYFEAKEKIMSSAFKHRLLSPDTISGRVDAYKMLMTP